MVEVTLDEHQETVGRIVEKKWPDEDLTQAVMGLGEEISELDDALHALHHVEGKLFRAIVKRTHGTRGSYEDWTAEVRKEAAQVLVILLDIARREGFSLWDALEEELAALEVKDVNHDPIGDQAEEGRVLNAAWTGRDGQIHTSGQVFLGQPTPLLESWPDRIQPVPLVADPKLLSDADGPSVKRTRAVSEEQLREEIT